MDPRIDRIREWRENVPTRDDLIAQADQLRDQLAVIEEQIVPAFVAPSGSHDAYNKGDRVFFEGRAWTSLIDGNVWSPSDYPQGWE